MRANAHHHVVLRRRASIECLVEWIWTLSNGRCFLSEGKKKVFHVWFTVSLTRARDSALTCNKSSRLSMYSMAFLSISTFGSRWFGFVLVRLLRTSNASFTCVECEKCWRVFTLKFSSQPLLTFRSLRRSLIVAARLRSTVTLFFLHALHAHVRQGWFLLAIQRGASVCSSAEAAELMLLLSSITSIWFDINPFTLLSYSEKFSQNLFWWFTIIS